MFHRTSISLSGALCCVLRKSLVEPIFLVKFHFWIRLLSPQGTVFKIHVQSCWKNLADRILQELVVFPIVDICSVKLIRINVEMKKQIICIASLLSMLPLF